MGTNSYIVLATLEDFLGRFQWKIVFEVILRLEIGGLGSKTLHQFFIFDANEEDYIPNAEVYFHGMSVLLF